MKKSLPSSVVNISRYFPRNVRSIPEYTFTHAQSQHLKVGIVSTFSLFLIALIFLQSVALHHNLRSREGLELERARLQSEITFWQGIADKYQGYRDVYYRIASLQYKLGNLSASQEYIKKALELDPNFPEGRVLGTQVGLK